MNTINLSNPAAKKQFGIFVGFFNKANNTKFSVKSAASNATLVNLYHSMAILTTQTGALISSQQPKVSAKRLSYSLVDCPKVDRQVFDYLSKTGPKTRAEISSNTGIRLQTVCGAVARLMGNDLVQFTGNLVKDPETNRLVELVTIK
jgi:hypothetical protein